MIFWRIKDKLQRLKWFIQRGRRGYADCDVWNFNDYLADVIIGGLLELKEAASFTVPGIFADNPAGWVEVLDEMIGGLEAYQKRIDYMREDADDIDLQMQREQQFDRAMDLLKEHWLELWD